MENFQVKTKIDTLIFSEKYIHSTAYESINNYAKLYQKASDEIFTENDSFLRLSKQIFQEISVENQSENMFYSKFERRNDTYSIFPYLIVILAVVLLLIPKITYRGSVKQVMQSVLSLNKFKLWMRDTDSLLKRIRIFSIPSYFIVFSIVLDFGIQSIRNGYYAFEFMKYFEVLGLLILYYFLRYLFISVSRFIFHTKVISDEYISNIHINNSGLLLLLIPILLINLSHQHSVLLIVLFTSVCLFEIHRIFRGILIAKSLKTYHLYYFFLYFCTVEILPLICIVNMDKILN